LFKGHDPQASGRALRTPAKLAVEVEYQLLEGLVIFDEGHKDPDKKELEERPSPILDFTEEFAEAKEHSQEWLCF
jgi:hypothetical protein